MTPEEKEHEENLAALVASNLSALQTADAVRKIGRNLGNTGRFAHG